MCADARRPEGNIWWWNATKTTIMNSKQQQQQKNDEKLRKTSRICLQADRNEYVAHEFEWI